ncbi:hypothetical protein [Conexibacter sp. SYSU D00693]|uniref:hypothetical protein n=1 Tax=Conexibacter sp. SYSU D00693 TaxID=2812560 RepID=UPI00196B2C86|nr:hypothetical protein [Conexibacter sp. SYSU D00693]
MSETSDPTVARRASGALAERAEDLKGRLPPAPQRADDRDVTAQDDEGALLSPVGAAAMSIAAAFALWIAVGWGDPIDQALTLGLAAVLAVAGGLLGRTGRGRAVKEWWRLTWSDGHRERVTNEDFEQLEAHPAERAARRRGPMG